MVSKKKEKRIFKITFFFFRKSDVLKFVIVFITMFVQDRYQVFQFMIKFVGMKMPIVSNNSLISVKSELIFFKFFKFLRMLR